MLAKASLFGALVALLVCIALNVGINHLNRIVVYAEFQQTLPNIVWLLFAPIYNRLRKSFSARAEPGLSPGPAADIIVHAVISGTLIFGITYLNAALAQLGFVGGYADALVQCQSGATAFCGVKALTDDNTFNFILLSLSGIVAFPSCAVASYFVGRTRFVQSQFMIYASILSGTAFFALAAFNVYLGLQQLAATDQIIGVTTLHRFAMAGVYGLLVALCSYFGMRMGARKS